MQGLDGGVHRVPAIPLVGNGVDSEDQTATRESAGGKGHTKSTEMEIDTLDGNKGPEISPAMVNPRRHISINEAHLAYINLKLDAIKGNKNTRPRSGGNGEHSCI